MALRTASLPRRSAGRARSAHLSANDRIASRNRRWLQERDILALNFVGAPGAGKTTLLEHTLQRLPGRVRAAVLEGDVASERDADRIRAIGAPVVQVNTDKRGHLDAVMSITEGEVEPLEDPHIGAPCLCGASVAVALPCPARIHAISLRVATGRRSRRPWQGRALRVRCGRM